MFVTPNAPSGRLLVAVGLAAAAYLYVPVVSVAQDTVDGAVWSIKLENVADSNKRLVARFRISNGEMYQKADMNDAVYSKRVGTAQIRGKQNNFEVDGLRAFAPRARTEFTIKGKGTVKVLEYGHWEGRFTDGRGRNWKMQAKRIIE